MTLAIRRALLSVSDKSGLEDFARQLTERGVELLATGGTHQRLVAAGISVREVADVTKFPEMMDGRVKTLHPRIHGGLLALRDDPAHVAAMEEHAIGAIDLVCVNLYPFEATVAKPGVARSDAIENIDIGGPSMLRSAAKNHRFVTVVTEPGDYARVLAELAANDGAVSEELRRELAQKAFATTARYDAAISRWLAAQDDPTGFPATMAFAGTKQQDLRYGENPHQAAALYVDAGVLEPSLASAEFRGGKELSYNNLVDLDAALALAKEFDEPFVAVTKHNNPCGAACGDTIADALEAAWSGDPLSAFGSVLAFNRPLDLASAKFLVAGGRFVEAIVAPAFETDAEELLRTKPKWGKNVRLLATGPFGPAARPAGSREVRPILGGFLVQDRDLAADSVDDLTTATERAPSDEQLEGLLFASKVAKHVKSNAIVLAQGRTVVGVGAGQMSRVDAVQLACHKAGDRAPGAVLASDAFFPFPDGPEAALAAGIVALLQPGGSIRDDAVIATCNARGAAMVLTGRRHFRH
ncbi:MAG: bifunctional phosphoribosylaminoimidazolecarboxamide formyltransferase/IMP cyclohydrolase [Planctomycetota bacterium]